jgi:hypothetical protein
MTRRKRLAGAVAAVVVVASGVSGCSVASNLSQPLCRSRYELSTVTLIAQSVHTARLVPCVESTVAGWKFRKLTVRRARTRIQFSSDRGGDRALEVTLTRSCDTSKAVRIPSDEPAAQRFETIEQLDPVYVGTRAYVFDGGCVAYRFKLATEQPSVLINEATLMLGFETREELRAAIRKESHGAVENGP